MKIRMTSRGGAMLLRDCSAGGGVTSTDGKGLRKRGADRRLLRRRIWNHGAPRLTERVGAKTLNPNRIKMMDAEQLVQLAHIYADNHAFITNEETAKMSLVVPFIRLLGYDPNIPREVRLEYTAEFTQGDGKRLPDRMDFAIFDSSGTRPLMVIETKPLGTDLKAKSQQLARYIAQLPDLHFGILTDGCVYLFYGDLESTNVMDKEPFFRFSLDDPKADWSKVASFLSKFSRDAFNAKTLLTDAENSRYRQAMIDKLVRVLRAPSDDETFMKWLTTDVYSGVRTARVRERMGELAREAVEPVLLRLMGDEFVDRLKKRIQAAREPQQEDDEAVSTVVHEDDTGEPGAEDRDDDRRREIVTTEEETQFVEIVRKICAQAGHDPDDILIRDTTSYCNASYQKPTKWFVRLFGDSRRKNITTWVPTDQARDLAPGREVEDAPSVFGVSRIYIKDIEDLWLLAPLITKSLETAIGERERA